CTSSLPRLNRGTVAPLTKIPANCHSTTSPLLQSTPLLPHHSHDFNPPSPAQNFTPGAIKKKNGKTKKIPVFFVDLLGSQKKLNMTLTTVNEQMTQLTSLCELACQIVQKNLEEKQLEEEQAVKAQSWKFPVCYDDDADEESSNLLNDNIISELPSYSAVTPTEPVDSLSMGTSILTLFRQQNRTNS
nr:hypothetical protein [Tanacetum cinerariifolium]